VHVKYNLYVINVLQQPKKPESNTVLQDRTDEHGFEKNYVHTALYPFMIFLPVQIRGNPAHPRHEY